MEVRVYEIIKEGYSLIVTDKDDLYEEIEKSLENHEGEFIEVRSVVMGKAEVDSLLEEDIF